MDGLQAIETINSWRRILIEGKPEQIDRILDDIERRLGQKGWARNSAMEAKMGRSADRKDRWLCFVGGPQDGPELMLCLTRVSDRRVRGGTYSLLNGTLDMQPTDIARVVEDVINSVLTPSASSFGLKVTIPRLGRSSRVGPKTLAALRAFSDLAAGAWPLPAEREPLWRRFVVSACQEDTAFDIDELSDWFVTNGWSSGDARALTERFVGEASLISEYNEETMS